MDLSSFYFRFLTWNLFSFVPYFGGIFVKCPFSDTMILQFILSIWWGCASLLVLFRFWFTLLFKCWSLEVQKTKKAKPIRGSEVLNAHSTVTWCANIHHMIGWWNFGMFAHDRGRAIENSDPELLCFFRLLEAQHLNKVNQNRYKHQSLIPEYSIYFVNVRLDLCLCPETFLIFMTKQITSGILEKNVLKLCCSYRRILGIIISIFRGTSPHPGRNLPQIGSIRWCTRRPTRP